MGSRLPPVSLTAGPLTITGPGQDRLTVDGNNSVEVLRSDAQFLRQLLFQIKSVAVGIEMQVLQNFFHRGQRGGRRAERIFVRRQFNDAVGRQAEFARDLLDGPSRLIDREMLQRGIERQVNGHVRALRVFCLCPRAAQSGRE